MVGYIAYRIEKAYDEQGLEYAQKQYKAYFVRTTMYRKFKADVDAILIADGYEAVIVG